MKAKGLLVEGKERFNQEILYSRLAHLIVLRKMNPRYWLQEWASMRSFLNFCTDSLESIRQNDVRHSVSNRSSLLSSADTLARNMTLVHFSFFFFLETLLTSLLLRQITFVFDGACQLAMRRFFWTSTPPFYSLLSLSSSRT
jgi:hypothetical protein